MDIKKLINAKSIDELKSTGSYFETKKYLEEKIKTKLCVNGWTSLYKRIQKLKSLTAAEREVLLKELDGKKFNESKKTASDIFGIEIKATGRRQLKEKITIILKIFYRASFDPYEYYEKTKLKKFKHSSSLEGIKVNPKKTGTSLESVLAKYRRNPHGQV